MVTVSTASLTALLLDRSAYPVLPMAVLLSPHGWGQGLCLILDSCENPRYLDECATALGT